MDQKVLTTKATTKTTYSKVHQSADSKEDIPLCAIDVMVLDNDNNSGPLALFEHVSVSDLIIKSWSPALGRVILITGLLAVITFFCIVPWVHRKQTRVLLSVLVWVVIVLVPVLTWWWGLWILWMIRPVLSSQWDEMVPHSTQVDHTSKMELKHTLRPCGSSTWDYHREDCLIRIPLAKISDVLVQKSGALGPSHVLTTLVVVDLSGGDIVDSFVETGFPPAGFLTCPRETLVQMTSSSTHVFGTGIGRSDDKVIVESFNRGIVRIEGLVDPHGFRNLVLQAIASA